MTTPRVAIIVPTLNAAGLWDRWVQGMRMQSLVPDVVLIVDSSSTDDTVQRAQAEGYRVHRIERKDFDHGGTRQLAVDLLGDIDIAVFLTQDAMLVDPDSVRNIVSSFDVSNVGMAYGRQLPRQGAGPIEAHGRLFNYPAESGYRSEADIPRLGLKTVYTSNSFSAYRVTALKEVGGFPSNVIVSEDMHVAARMVMAGWQVHYNAEAVVEHSHGYSPLQELQRYFDVGVFNAREHWIMQHFGAPTGEGMRLVLSELRFLGFRKCYRMPETMLRTFLKLAGFRLGLHEQALPRWLKPRLSMQKWFWR